VNDLEYHLYEEARTGRMTRKQILVRGSVLGISASAMSAILAACGTSASTSSSSTPSGGAIKRGGTLRLGVSVPAQDVDPVTMYNEGAIATADIALEYLCYPDPAYVLQPKLATKWAPGADASTWDFTIRQGVQWQDGTPFTVDDVVATFDRLTDPKSGSAALSQFAGVLSAGNIERKDDQTVTFHLDRVYSDFPYLVSAFTYTSLITPKNYEIGTFTNGGIGTGAFILKTYDKGQQATFTKNPHYWDKGKPYLDGVVMKYFSDNAPQVAALQAGAIDAMVETPYQGSQALFSDPNITILENPSTQYRTLQMRVDEQPFSSKELRQAVAYGLNRPDLITGLFNGKAVLGNDHVGGRRSAARAGHRQGQAARPGGHRQVVDQRHADDRGLPRDPRLRHVREGAAQARGDQRRARGAAAVDVLRDRLEPAVAPGAVRHHRLGRPRDARPDHRPGVHLRLRAEQEPLERGGVELGPLVQSAVRQPREAVRGERRPDRAPVAGGAGGEDPAGRGARRDRLLAGGAARDQEERARPREGADVGGGRQRRLALDVIP
jgi:hypothetical protein